MLCSRACVLLSPRDLVPSCSRALHSSCPLAIVPPSCRIGKNQVTRCYFVIWLLASSSLILSPALSPSQAKAHAPSVTRFPFLLVQVFKIMLPPKQNLHFLKIKVLLSRDSKRPLQEPQERPQELQKRPQESPQDPSKSPQRRSKSSKRGLSYSQEDPKDAPRAPKVL